MDLAADILQSGKVLCRYRIDHKLGGGGMGDVYKATDLELERPVALKVLNQPAAQNAAKKGQLLREARLACSLTHSNIVTIHAIERAEGVEFIVMEYVQGETLRDLLRDGPLDLDQLLDIGADIADALAAAHEIGLLHRDIKPANIMITPKGRAKVLDFGLAKRVSARESTLDTLSQSTTENVVKGTIPYMSPEQTRAEPLDARSDIFSLGSVLYECATGERPFPGSEAHEIMRAIVSHDPPPASRLRPDLHAGLDLVLATAMAKDRSNRLPTALEFSKALRSLRAGQAPETGRVIRGQAPTSDLPNNLPPQITSFIGREREIAQIKRLFSSSRLITLTGSGGCGKTRLALRVAHDLLAECADGVWFVDLAPLSDPDLLPQTVASALSIREEPGKSFKETLADHLIGKSLLLILDNCEHLVSACAMLTRDLLHACPGLHILVTSREPLQIAGEAVWRTPSLSVPSETDDLQRLRDSEAVRLFLARAEAAHSHFTLGKQNAPVVGQICRRLDGIPLAIELAAARAGALAPQEILSRLEDRFRLLGRDTHGVLPRQRTLRATIDWSYELLSIQEQQVFQRLGVFAASFALEAAESVCAGGGIESSDLVHIVTRLFEKSLISAEEDSAGGGRYRLPETLRAYARERLRAANEEAPIWRSHRDYFLSVVESAERELQGPDQARWFNRLDADNEDIRVAIQGALDGRDASIAARFCGSLWRFWWVRGMWSEGRGKIQGTLALSEEGVSPAARVKLFHGGAVLARGQGAYDEAESLLQRGLDLARAHSDSRGIATIQHELGNIANERGDLPKARSLYESSLALWRKLEDKRGISSALHNLGVVAQSQRDNKAAQRLYQESLGIQRELGNRAWEAAGLNGLGSVALAQGQLPAARSCHEEALSIQKDLGDRWGMAFSLRELGLVAEGTGELTAAQGLLEESLRILRDLGDREGIAESLEGLVALAVAQAQPDRALRLAGAAWALRAAIGSPLMPSDRERLEGSVREAKQALRKEAASQAYADGRGLSLNQAVRYALQEESDAALTPSAR